MAIISHKINRFAPQMFTLFCIILEVYVKPASTKRPSYLPTCYRNDPQLSQCLLKATEQVRPYLVKGLPDLKIPSFEPFVIPQITLEQGTNSVNLKAVLTNVVIHGLTKYKFTRFDFDVKNYQFFCEATVPRLDIDGDYVASGRILVALIEGKGKFTAQIDSAKVFVYQKYKVVTLNDGQEHLVPVISNSTIDVVKPRAHLDGLFNGNEDLSAATNKAINDNVDALFQELKPIFERTLSSIMDDLLLKSIMSNISWDELYPVNPDFN